MQENQTTFRPSRDRRRILLIEDEYVNQEILKMFLEDRYDLVVAGTGTEALNIIRSQYEMLSLILLDLNLPDLSGLDILRQVKADSRTARLPVIVATSDGDAEVECLTLGAIDFISKPYPRQEVVLARVLRTIELSEDRDTLSLTERDHLTGLYNKEFFNRYAAQLDIHHRDCPMDAIVLNVNQFHMINDRYGKPVMICENGFGAYDKLEADGSVHDPYRIEYIREHIKAMKRAIDNGVTIIAYNPWSAFDLLSTSNGIAKRYGFIYVDRTDDDVKECKRYKKDSFYWYQRVIASNGKNLE